MPIARTTERTAERTAEQGPGCPFVAQAGHRLTDRLVVRQLAVAGHRGRTYVYRSLDSKAAFTFDAEESGQALGAMFLSVPGDLDGDAIVNGKADIPAMGQFEWSAKRIKQ